MILKTFSRYTQLNDQTVPFLSIQFCISQKILMVASPGMYL